MNWLFFAITSALSFGLYNFFSRLSGEKVNPIFGAIILTGVSLIVTIIYAVANRALGELNFAKSTIIFPVVAGVFAGVADILYLYMFQKGAPLNVGNPLVVGGTVLFATILGTVILRESLSGPKILGVLVILAGLVILARS